MKIREHASIEAHNLPGIEHKTLAGPNDQLRGMEVWMQTMAPGSSTPVHRHDCEEVIVILRGSGVCNIEGEAEPRRFGPNATLILQPNEVHQIVNTGTEDMFLIAALGMAPVRAEAQDGTQIPLPWDQR